MTELNPILDNFVENVRQQQAVWGLQDDSGEGWVVCDSSEYEDTDVMPLWSSQAQAKEHCSEEWADYTPVSIPLVELLEFWISDLNDDGVLLGINWQSNDTCLEFDAIELAKNLVEAEEE